MLEMFKRKITKDQSRDTGMAMVLLLFILSVSLRRQGLVYVAIGLHVVNMIVPQIYRPVAVVWLGLADLLGAVVSKVLMFIVFIAVVTPIGLVRRMMGHDSLKLRAFKSGPDSVMLVRNRLFTAQDLERPY